jgi:hypothetical protein
MCVRPTKVQLTPLDKTIDQCLRPLLELPFVPFTVLFCHVIGTSSASDLRYLESLVRSLQTASSKQSIYPICAKQFRIFEALFNVAREYIQTASSLHEGEDVQGQVDANSFVELFGLTVNNGNSQSMGAFGLSPNSMEAAGTDSYGQYWNEPGSRDGLQEAPPGDSRAELDMEGAKLGDWFQKNHDMMRLMEVNF